MSISLNRQPYSSLKLDQILTFASQSPLMPYYDFTLVKRFLTDLVSSEQFVFDIFEDNKRVATAALLDRPKNAANSANLEIIGFNSQFYAEQLFTMILNLSKESLPTFRDAIDIGHYDSYPISPSLLIANDFKFSYSIYDMITNTPRLLKTQIQSPLNLSPITKVDFEEYHSVVMKAFAKNEDANITPLEEMRAYVLNSKILPTVLKKDKMIIGFLSLIVDETTPSIGEINTIGLLPEFQGKGLGKLLLGEALIQLNDIGVKSFKLSVSAKNDRALTLYQQFGFKIHEKSSVYRWH